MFSVSDVSLIFIFPIGIHTYWFPLVSSSPASASSITIPCVTSVPESAANLNPSGTFTGFLYLSYIVVLLSYTVPFFIASSNSDNFSSSSSLLFPLL